MFLAGLEVHGRGAWTSISKNFVQTRTASQVASHAQKYFSWLCKSKDKEKANEMGGRSSFFDITTVAGAMKARAGEPSMHDVAGNALPWGAVVNDFADDGMGGTLPPPPDYGPLVDGQQTIPGAPVEGRAWPGLGPAPYIFNVAQLEAWMQQGSFFDKQNGKS